MDRCAQPPYGLADDVYQMTAGADGAVWYARWDDFRIGRITTSGSVSDYDYRSLGYYSEPHGITAGPDGNIWFTGYHFDGSVLRASAINVVILAPDTTPPVSHVHPLPPVAPSSNFTVQWSGTDSGSGICGYTVYASENGGRSARG